MGEDPELTDRAMQSEIELLADLMTAATAGGVLTQGQVDDALGVLQQKPADPEVS
jgi:hypothetical protein